MSTNPRSTMAHSYDSHSITCSVQFPFLVLTQKLKDPNPNYLNSLSESGWYTLADSNPDPGKLTTVYTPGY